MQINWKFTTSFAVALACLTGCHHQQPAAPTTDLSTPATTMATAEAMATTEAIASTEMSATTEPTATTEPMATMESATAPTTAPAADYSGIIGATMPSPIPGVTAPPTTMPATMPTTMPMPTMTPVPVPMPSPTMPSPATTPVPATMPVSATMPAGMGMSSAPAAPILYAIATIEPKSGSHVSGTVTQTADGVQVVADIDGLTPGKHGFHIHQYADLSDEKGEGAGGHYDPEHTHHHGLPGDPMPHHPGDMGNLIADDSGHAHLEILLTGVTIAGDKDPILGRSVVVHAKPDDGGEPTGNAGGRVGVGVIGVAKAPL
jgi:superoxide dismutase, Cu-Zn family